MTEAAQAVALPTRSVEHRPFFEVWLPSFLVVFAGGLALFSLNFWIAHSRGGGGLLGVVAGAANIGSVVVVVVFSGVIDRTDRSRFALRAAAVVLIALGGLLFAYVVGPSPAVLAVAAAAYLLVECANSVYMATIETTVADLAPASWSPRRTASLVQLQPQFERTISPIVGSALIATGFLAVLPMVGLGCVAITALLTLKFRASFALPGRALGEAPAEGGTTAALRRSLRDSREAFRWIRGEPALLYLVLVGIVTNLVVFPFYVLLPAFLTEYDLSKNAQALLYGQAATAYGIGMLVSTGLLARFARRSSRAVEYSTLCVLIMCGVLASLSLSPQPRAIVPGMAVVGLVFIVLVAVAGGAWLEKTPSELRVRVFSIRRLIVFSSIPLGTSLMGLGGAAFGYFSFLRVLLAIVAAVIGASFVAYTLSARWRADREIRP